MNKLLITLLLIPTYIFAMSGKPLTTCTGVNWKDSVQRADNSPLLPSDIAYITLYMDGKPYKGNGKDITRFHVGWQKARWFTPVGSGCPKCVTGVTTDTLGQDSAMSSCL